MEKEEILFTLPDLKQMKCINCKYGICGFQRSYCAKFSTKPKEVYYEGGDCPEFKGK